MQLDDWHLAGLRIKWDDSTCTLSAVQLLVFYVVCSGSSLPLTKHCWHSRSPGDSSAVSTLPWHRLSPEALLESKGSHLASPSCLWQARSRRLGLQLLLPFKKRHLNKITLAYKCLPVLFTFWVPWSVLVWRSKWQNLSLPLFNLTLYSSLPITIVNVYPPFLYYLLIFISFYFSIL